MANPFLSQWLDVRFRFLVGAHNKVVNATFRAKREIPPSHYSPGRKDLFNTRIHGGNLRDDAIMIKVNYPGASHGRDSGYGSYITRVFPRIYELSVDKAYWLGR